MKLGEVALQKTYESIASVSEFMKQLDTEDFQSDLADKVCGDAGMQKLYMWLLQGQNMMYGLRDLLTKIATCCEQGLDCSAVARQCRSAITTMMEFIEPTVANASVFSLSTVTSFIGSATLCQALTRTLKTGETRQVLVNKALLGTKRRGWIAHGTLTKRCNLVLTGKAGVSIHNLLSRSSGK